MAEYSDSPSLLNNDLRLGTLYEGLCLRELKRKSKQKECFIHGGSFRAHGRYKSHRPVHHVLKTRRESETDGRKLRIVTEREYLSVK